MAPVAQGDSGPGGWTLRITNLRKEGGAGERVAARVEWEECDRPPLDLYCETEPEFAGSLNPSPDAFLVACAIPAASSGERRIRIEGSVCPRLGDGLVTAIRQLAVWFGPRPIPEIEPTGGFDPPVPRNPACSALFLTGGVDSFHLLNLNRLRFPADHPERFKFGLVVSGMHAPGQERSDRARRHARRVRESLSRPAAEAGITLVPTLTNVLQLQPDVSYLAHEFLGAALVFSAHALSSRLSSIAIASGTSVEKLFPFASHPMLDPNYGSSALAVRHEGVRFSRSDKLKALFDWETAFRRLIVCGDHPEAPLLNCGRCEKCLRTMVAILALGGSLAGGSFPASDVRAEDLRAISIPLGPDYHWRYFLPLLASRGREDLVRAIRPKLRTVALRRMDRRWFGGRLVESYRRFRKVPS